MAMADDDAPPASAGADGGNGPTRSSDESAASSRRFGAREVVVTLRVYKVVTVFSTLIAVVFVVGGFLGDADDEDGDKVIGQIGQRMQGVGENRGRAGDQAHGKLGQRQHGVGDAFPD
jgi:hypothetical protein